LTKDLVLAVVDGGRGLGNGLVMPAGPLRAPLEFQLELTDAIIVNESTAAVAAAGSVTEWLRHRFAGPVLRASVVPADVTDWLKGARIVGWAGIGAPQRFFATLRSLGADVVEAVAFRDHQPLGDDDARRLLDLARRHSATLVTTQKDMARLAGARGPCSELRAATQVLPVRLALAEADAERLMSLVATALQTPRG
jgi:tetraacyldisaccharide 4'-kinase